MQRFRDKKGSNTEVFHKPVNGSSVSSRLKKGDASFSESQSVFEESRARMIEIVNLLSEPCPSFRVDEAAKKIDDYVKREYRVLYSEITSRVYEVLSDERSTMLTNIEALVKYSYDHADELGKRTPQVAVKINDHFNLAIQQVEKTKDSLEVAAKNTKDELYDEMSDRLKRLETEYITILGIFASVVLAFIGGLVFSTSVLQNMGSVGIYRLVLVVLLLGFVLINTINILLRYIFKLNHAEKVKIPIMWVNIVFGVLLILLLISWMIQAHEIPAYIGKCLPWGK